MPQGKRSTERPSKDYAGGSKSPPANSPPHSPIRGMTEGDMGKYGIGDNTPVQTLKKPDKKWREVAGGGSAGGVQRKKPKPHV
jgi:hypothetical protein